MKNSLTAGLVSVLCVYLFKMNDLMEYYLEYHLRAIVTDKGMKILTKFIKNQTQQHA